MKLLFLESYFGGSHAEFARGLVEHSRHDIDLFTMPGRNWQWRMRGAALHFFQEIGNIDIYDGLIITDLMSLSDFKALIGGRCPPVLVYFHENQITYPEIAGKHNDVYFGIIDMTTALSADRILFNSKMHMNGFLAGIKAFASRMPDFQPQWIHDAVADKSGYLYPGVRFPKQVLLQEKDAALPPLIIWNHRWGYDKNAGAFFAALDKMLSCGIEFRLAVLGDDTAVKPEEFLKAKDRYGNRIVQFGYIEDRDDYIGWLKTGDIVISTARQENFGMAVVEAMRYGCIPLLPNRLSYPEILPDRFHKACIYNNKEDMDQKLENMLKNRHQYSEQRAALSETMGRFAWKNMIDDYEAVFENLFSDA